jgi:hypothetical protein
LASLKLNFGLCFDFFLKQVLALLSTTNLAYSSEESVAKYEKILECIHSTGSFIAMPPYKSFFCPLTKEIMNDPVTICSGQSYEREAIEKWFAAGNVTDPESNQVNDFPSCNYHNV